jgi:hypothetical protein
MKLIDVVVPSNFNVFCFSDVHVGSTLCFRNGLFEMFDMINSSYDGIPPEHNFALDGGDGIEAILQDDKRFHPDTVEGDPMYQIEEYVKLMRHVKNQLLVMLDSNHHAKLWRFGNISERMCRELQAEGSPIQYGTWTAKVTFHDKYGMVYKHFTTHGRKSINSTADDPMRRRVNMQLVLKRHLKMKFADCAVMAKGHTHKLLVCEPTKDLYLTDDGHDVQQRYTSCPQTAEYIHPDLRWYINTGSFLRLYQQEVSGYAEQAEYDPVELGFVIVKVRDRQVVDCERVVLPRRSKPLVSMLL